MSSRASKKNRGLCVYCLLQKAQTLDHVVPKCMFPKGEIPANYSFKVPACKQCNGSKAKLDSYLRDLAVCDYRSSQSATAQKICNDTVRRSLETKRSLLLKQAQYLTWERQVGPDGTVADLLPTLPVEIDKLEEALSYLTRGLYYKLIGSALPRQLSVSALTVPSTSVEMCTQNMLALPPTRSCQIGEVFACLVVHDLKQQSFWLMRFYESVYFTVKVLIGADRQTAAQC